MAAPSLCEKGLFVFHLPLKITGFSADTDCGMENTLPKNVNVRPAVIATAVSLAACFGILVWVMQLWRADWHVPFAYSKDALLCGMLAKTVSETGWYLHNPLLGAPGVLDYYDYPFGDILHFALLWLISQFTRQFGALMNVFFILSFPLTTLAALGVLRRFTLSWPCASVGALLYTFLPYHFLRGEPHLFLSMYWVVPLAILVMAWIGEDAPPDARRPRLAVSLAVCVALGLTGYYYAYFAAVLFLVAGVDASLRGRCAKPLGQAALLAAVVAAVCVATALPNLAYWHAHGTNVQVAQREPREADYYGLKIAQLVLPVTGHRLPAQTALKDNYNDSMLLINENDDSTLGVIGSMGFLLLLACLPGRGTGLFPPLLERLAILNISAVLLGTIGGFGSLVALLALPQIRSYNRLSVFIAFFALCAVMSLLDLWYRQTEARPRARLLCLATLCALLAFGIFDQTSPSFVPDYPRLARQFSSDARFIHNVELAAPPDARIYQLPSVPFPENAQIARMTDYQQFRGYLHSTTLHWSYGTMKGRSNDPWRQGASCGNVQAITHAGFQGILVNADGYADGGAVIIRHLTQALHAPPLVNDDHRLYFFRLKEPLL